MTPGFWGRLFGQDRFTDLLDATDPAGQHKPMDWEDFGVWKKRALAAEQTVKKLREWQQENTHDRVAWKTLVEQADRDRIRAERAERDAQEQRDERASMAARYGHLLTVYDAALERLDEALRARRVRRRRKRS